jgi:hypothetical protein
MHACATLAMRDLKPEEHCHAWLTLGSYKATYSYLIHSVNSQIYWEPTPYDKHVPPKVRRDAGRPKKNISTDGNEKPVCGSNMKKTYDDTQCGKCGLFGHNSMGCVKQNVSKRPKIGLILSLNNQDNEMMLLLKMLEMLLLMRCNEMMIKFKMLSMLLL